MTHFLRGPKVRGRKLSRLVLKISKLLQISYLKNQKVNSKDFEHLIRELMAEGETEGAKMLIIT